MRYELAVDVSKETTKGKTSNKEFDEFSILSPREKFVERGYVEIMSARTEALYR